MKTYWMVLLAFISWGCATAEMGRYIGPQDVTWIQKGVTTRSEVVQRLGPPLSETPDWTAMQFQSVSTTTTSKEGESQQSVTTTIYLHTKSEGGLFVGFTTTQEQFWVSFDEHGIVQNYGFQSGPGMSLR
jgi:hypothetical protein